MPEPQYTNHLIRETSPYLLQHAHNPVDWYPWGEEAFQKAKEEDKPILLSCGYSACHWCHVMERESFEDPDIAKLMNKYFVNIKVDREERPDIDQLYQEAVQALTGQGGWPLTVFLDHERRPFFGGTYFPPEPMYGRSSFPQVLGAIHQSWMSDRERIQLAGREMFTFLQAEQREQPKANSLPDRELPMKALARLADHFDPKNGGFGGSPKFPNSVLLQLFLRIGRQHKLEAAVEQVLFTLRQMAKGGIYDQIGGGFHRYATDPIWLAPHFEKMLYDNAQLLRVYTIAFQITGEDEFSRTAKGIAAYLQREMTAPEGGFYATQDADSEGEEGKYFLWTKEELEQILGEETAGLFGGFYGVTASGNFEGRNILNRLDQKRISLNSDQITKLRQAETELLRVREERVKPFRDEKVITSWNGLAIGALSHAYQVFGIEDYYLAAKRATEFVINNSKLADGSLARIYKDGQAKIAALLDDYTFLAQGLLDLYEAGFNESWLEQSLQLTERASQKFSDQSGRYYLNEITARDLAARPSSGRDQAIPSGVAIQLENLLRLAAFTGREDLKTEGERILRAYRDEIAADPWGMAGLINGLDAFYQGFKEFTFIDDQVELPEILLKLRQVYIPYRILVRNDSLKEGLANHPARELLKNHDQFNGKPTCYACFDYHCMPPITEWCELQEILEG